MERELALASRGAAQRGPPAARAAARLTGREIRVHEELGARAVEGAEVHGAELEVDAGEVRCEAEGVHHLRAAERIKAARS